MNDGIAPGPRSNRLLAALMDEDGSNWLPLLRPTRLEQGQMLSVHEAVFPTTATISLFASTRAGDCTEVATVGNEGFVGIALLSGAGSGCEQAEVTMPGHAYTIAGATLRGEFLRQGATMKLLLRYMQLQMAQAMQQALCVQHHSIEQRLCRCLLDSLDRSRRRATIELTHQSLASRLGVRRETVTTSAQRLQGQGIITYKLGVITVHDVAALRAASCSCHAELRAAADRLLPRPAAELMDGADVHVPGLAGTHLAVLAHRTQPQDSHEYRHRTHDPASHHDRTARQRAAGSAVDG